MGNVVARSLLCVDTTVAMSDHCTDMDETLFEMMDRTQIEKSCRPNTDNNSLHYLTYKLLASRTNNFEGLEVDRQRLQAFLDAVSRGYNDLPFHNVLHVRDVVSRLTVLLFAEDCPEFTAVQHMALVIGAAVHDLDHFGMSNKALVESGHPLAQRHPTSTMEHHHYECFEDMMHCEDQNFLHAWSKKDETQFKYLVKNVIMSTDIAAGFLSLQRDDFTKALPQMKLVMRCADIGHCGSPWHLHFRWAERLCMEHTNENKFMTAEFKKDQVAFMQKVACPTFKKLHEVIPSAQIWYARCLANTERWEGTIPQALCAYSAKGVEREYDARPAICVS